MADSGDAPEVRIVGVAPVTGMWKFSTVNTDDDGVDVESSQVAALVTVERGGEDLSDLVPLPAEDLSNGKVMDALRDFLRSPATDFVCFYGDDIDAVRKRVESIAREVADRRSRRSGHSHTMFEADYRDPPSGPYATVWHYPESCPKCEEEAK